MPDPKCTACNGTGRVDYCWHDRTCDGMWHLCDYCVVDPNSGKWYPKGHGGRRTIPKKTRWVPLGGGYGERP